MLRKVLCMPSIPAPSDDQLLRCWYNERVDTNEISRRFKYPEYCVESRLWRLRKGAPPAPAKGDTQCDRTEWPVIR